MKQDNGLRMYTDDRHDDIEDDDVEDSESDESEEDYINDEEIEEQDDEEQNSSDDDSSEEEDDLSGDDQGGDDQGGDPPGGGGRKRPRDDDNDDDGSDGQGDDGDQEQEPEPSPPPRKTRRLGSIPPEIQLQIMDNLNFAQLWNLVASPEGYLGDSINMVLLDAYQQHAIDYPDAGNGDDDDEAGGGGDSDGNGSYDSEDVEDSGSDDGGIDTRPDDDPNRPLSLLQWVARRVIYDSAFRAANGRYINQLIDTYLQVYGQDNPHVTHENVIKDILWFFRPQTGMAPYTQIMHAAAASRPGIIHLLLLRGENVNHQAFDDPAMTLLNEASDNQHLEVGRGGVDGMQTVFALIGAGADVTQFPLGAQTRAQNILRELLSTVVPAQDQLQDNRWPRIIKVQGLSVREFIADDRSDYYERVILAMFAIYTRHFDYAAFL